MKTLLQVIMENLTEKIALEFLESKGYLTDYLYHRSDVQKKYNVSNEEADEILRAVVGSDGIVERIEDGIEILCDANKIKSYDELTEFDVLDMSREKLIDFLYWNDSNGCWEDEDDFPPLTLDEAREFAIRYILCEETQSDEYGYPTENQHFLKLTLAKLNK